MLLHHHFLSVRSEQEFTGLLTALGVLGFCQPLTNKQNQTVKYHLEKNTINSRAFTTGYLTNLGFQDEISNFALSSVGINVEEKLFSGQFAPNRHIQIVYSDDSKSFQMLNATGQPKLDINGDPRITHNEFIVNLHLEYNPKFQGNLHTQLQNIADLPEVKNITQNATFEKLFATEITTFSNSSIQAFYDYCYNPTQDFTILELDPTISQKKLTNLQKTKSIKQKQLAKVTGPQIQVLKDQINNLDLKIQEIQNIPTFLNSNLSHETLEIFPPATVTPIVANNPVLPPAIPDQAHNLADDKDPTTSLTTTLDNLTINSNDNNTNTDVVSSGENSEDALDPLT